MKKILLILLVALSVFACKEDAKQNTLEDSSNEMNDGLTLLKGEFIYYADAAVLQTNSEMYGVVIDDKMHELNEKAKPFKNAETDFVMIEIKGEVTPKPEDEEGWPYRVTIKEIINVTQIAEQGSEVVKIGKE